MKKFVSKVLTTLSNLFFPSNFSCLFCDNDVEKGKIICNECLQDASFNKGKRCILCDMPICGDGDVCDFCISHHKAFDKAMAPCLYADKAKNVVIRLKTKSEKYLAPKMAQLMAARFLEENLYVDVIVPVPLSNRSMEKRHFNQSQLLATELGKILKIPVTNCLAKTKETPSQKDLNFVNRQKNLNGAFSVTDKKSVFGKNVLLVDDVITTCATSNECAKTLKKYAKRVYVLAFARRDYKNL